MNRAEITGPSGRVARIQRIRPCDGGKNYRTEKTFDGENGETCKTKNYFAALGLNRLISANLAGFGFIRPTPVQHACIPAILRGNDVIGTAQTGTGKTAAFALPILQLLSEDPYGIFCLCLTPTRELAIQIAEQFDAFSTGMHLRCLVIIGGEDLRVQAASLATRPHIVVATPGRLVEHFVNDILLYKVFSKLRTLVLDEADRLLDPGFETDLRAIMHNVPNAHRQTLLFSATITRSITAVKQVTLESALYFEEFVGIKVVKNCAHEYCLVPSKVKDVFFVHLLNNIDSGKLRSVIVFAGTVYACQLLQETCAILGIDSVALHALKKQRQRVTNLSRFKSGQVGILIATDIASRGLDIPFFDLVIHYEVPAFSRDYVHRVGRTARAGRWGKSVALVSQHEVALIHQIERITGVDMIEVPGIREADVLKDIARVFAARRGAKLKMSEAGGFDDHLRERKHRNRA